MLLRRRTLRGLTLLLFLAYLIMRYKKSIGHSEEKLKRLRERKEEITNDWNFESKRRKHKENFRGDIINLPKDSEWIKYPLSFCRCFRYGHKLENTDEDVSSTCSDYSTQRGKDQKVVSYSYYNIKRIFVKGEFLYRKYYESLLSRAEEVLKYYPKWVMRVYHNVSTYNPQETDVLCQLYCEYNHVDLCDVTKLPVFGDKFARQNGMFWRFLVLGDPTVSIFIIRDSDSLIQKREVEAVNEWLKSEKTFHVMRDHPSHLPVILGGLWGAKTFRVMTSVRLRNELLNADRSYAYGYDQRILREIIWPIAKKDVMQHDSFTCKVESHRNSLPFPTIRENDYYVGWGPVGKEIPLKRFRKSKCPIQCRLPHHLDKKKC